MSLVNLLGLSRVQMEDFVMAQGEPRYRAHQILRWLHHRFEPRISEWLDISKRFRTILLQITTTEALTLTEQHESKDGTLKFLFCTSAGNTIETVLIPHEGRNTLCVSSQVGCAMSCTFCATGKQGFLSNLTPHEIISQMWVVQSTIRPTRISNVVFMGMGEPLLNLNAVLPSVSLLLDDLGYGLSKRRVTISTCGIVPAMYQLIEENGCRACHIIACSH